MAVRNWRPPKQYKTIRDAEQDFAEGLRRVTEGIEIMNEVGSKLNETNPGQGDILYGAAAMMMKAAEELGKSSNDIQAAMNGRKTQGLRARKLMQLAIRHAPTATARKAIRNRQKITPAT